MDHNTVKAITLKSVNNKGFEGDFIIVHLV